MYDLHTHSLLSDGVLLPSEICVRYLIKKYHVIAITDHVDYSNISQTIASILKFTQHWPKKAKLKILPGIELTHLPLEQFEPLAKYARKEGIKIIVAHGETPAEPVIKGTNQAALEADIDILAHPGLLADKEIKLARKKGIFLELSSRKGHCDTNAYVAECGFKLGAKLILNTDSHLPEDILSPMQMRKVAYNLGLTHQQIENIYKEVRQFLKKKRGERCRGR